MFKWLVINSKDRLSSSNSSVDFTVQFKQLIDGCTCFELESAQIPNLFYNITSANQWIDFNDGTASVSAQLAAGLYSLNGNTVSASILSEVGTAMTAASSGHGGLTFTATYSATTGLITISGGGTTSFTLLFNSGSHSATSAGYILGFGAVDYASATTQTAANAPNLNAFNYLQISVNGYNSCLTTNNGFGTFVIPVNVNAGDIIIYNQQTPHHFSNYFRKRWSCI